MFNSARRATGSVLLLTILVSGCGAGKTSVSGTVRLGGQVLPSGTVLFHSEDGRVAHGLIDANGNYTIDNPPRGPVRITVRSHPAMPVGMPSSGRAPATSMDGVPDNKDRSGKYVPISERYLYPDHSGLTYTVRAGTQTHDIDLLP